MSSIVQAEGLFLNIQIDLAPEKRLPRLIV